MNSFFFDVLSDYLGQFSCWKISSVIDWSTGKGHIFESFSPSCCIACLPKEFHLPQPLGLSCWTIHLGSENSRYLFAAHLQNCLLECDWLESSFKTWTNSIGHCCWPRCFCNLSADSSMKPTQFLYPSSILSADSLSYVVAACFAFKIPWCGPAFSWFFRDGWFFTTLVFASFRTWEWRLYEWIRT